MLKFHNNSNIKVNIGPILGHYIFIENKFI